ncbi:MAG: threonine synthase, partial [Candidatus Nanohaloarchaea archaeon]|nr:threonine synthase [Candidatus Nanohaloarchaea archaeon]
MYEQHLACRTCGDTYPSDRIRYRCDCGGSLDVVYDYNAIQDQVDWDVLKQRAFTHHRYREFYPIIDNDHIIAMGE